LGCVAQLHDAIPPDCPLSSAALAGHPGRYSLGKNPFAQSAADPAAVKGSENSNCGFKFPTSTIPRFIQSDTLVYLIGYNSMKKLNSRLKPSIVRRIENEYYFQLVMKFFVLDN